MQLQNFFIFIIDCIGIVISYVLASYLRFGNMWGGYEKSIVLIRVAIFIIAITFVYFVFNPNRRFFNRNKKQELRAVLQNVVIIGSGV